MFERFEQFLVSNGSIVTTQIPYYVKWVKDYYTIYGCIPEKIRTSDQKKQYLDGLENTREDWQVKQSLRLYMFFILRHGQRPVATTDEGKLWGQILEKMIKVMRLKHLSLNTEKTYTTWGRQFRHFVNGKSHNDLTSDDIRTIHQSLGHNNIMTTMIYTHVTNKNFLGVRNPLDTWPKILQIFITVQNLYLFPSTGFHLC